MVMTTITIYILYGNHGMTQYHALSFMRQCATLRIYLNQYVATMINVCKCKAYHVWLDNIHGNWVEMANSF